MRNHLKVVRISPVSDESIGLTFEDDICLLAVY
jgi:hypothetical protein